MKTASIDRARVEIIAGKILDFFRANLSLAMDKDQWRTVNGAKVLIGEGGEIKGGLGGKFTGQRISGLSKKEGPAAKDWPENFPNVTALTTVAKMKNHPHYQAAKAGNKVGRTGSDAMYRLAYRPKFDGLVEKGRQYILVDDVVTGGGTLSELRHHIESHGGQVVHMMSAGTAQFSANIALSSKTRLALEEKYGVESLNQFLKEHKLYGGNHKALTESEARTLLGAGSLDAARNRIAAARQEGSPQAVQGTAGPGKATTGQNSGDGGNHKAAPVKDSALSAPPRPSLSAPRPPAVDKNGLPRLSSRSKEEELAMALCRQALVSLARLTPEHRAGTSGTLTPGGR